MKRLLAFLFSEYVKHPWLSVVIIGLMAITLTFQVFFSMAFKYLIDDILIPEKYEMISGFLLLIIVGALVSSICDVFNDYIVVKLGTDMQNKFRLSIFSHLQLLPESFYLKSSTGVLQTRTSVDLNHVHTGFLNVQPIIFSVMGFIISVGFLFSLNWHLTILAIIGLPFCFLLPRLMNDRVVSINELYKSKNSIFGELFYERLAAHGLFRAFGLRNWEYKRMEETIEGLTPIAVESRFLSILMHKSVVITLLILNVVIISIGGFLVKDHTITIGALVAFQSLFIGISGYIASFTTYLPQFIQSALSLQRLQVILDEEPSVEERKGIDFLPSNFKQAITYHEVSFEYISQVPILQNITMCIPLFSKCAVVGSSGSGKTSIISLLLRLYEPTKGQLMIDDIDIRDISSRTLRDMIGFVPQDIILLNLSIRENIRLGNMEATDTDIEEAAKLAGIHQWIVSSPQGYDFVVGERGRNLSGGQKQRIAIARALVRHPSILVLDEATSVLDPATEDVINKTITRLAGSSTIISVTHRLQSVIDSDCIFVMANGKIVNYGTHAELLMSSEDYQKMWMKQSGFNVSENGKRAGITVDRLKQIPLFMDLEPLILEEMKEYMVPEHYEEGRNVVVQGDEGDKFYIVVRGKVEVLLQQGPNQEKRLAVLDDGDYFGEMALLKEIPRTATIRTLTPCIFLSMDRSHFQKSVEKSTNFRERLENTYKQRLSTHK